MGIHIDRRRKEQLIFFTLVFMLLSLFTSRALLSVSFILFLFLTCFHKNFLQQFFRFVKNPFLLGIGFLFLIPFVSGLWSGNQAMWLRFVRIKLPLFLFPIAFAGDWQLSAKQWRKLAYSFLILVAAGCCWSFFQYIQNPHLIHGEYLKAKVFSTPLGNDHVRFSLVVCVAVVCCVLLFKEVLEKKTRVLLSIACLFFMVYLHVLSARTGLIALYLFLLFGIFYLLFLMKERRWTIVLVLLFLAMPLLAWFLFPTFQNRIRYNVYDLSNVRENKYLPGSNDGNRVLSLKAGWMVLKRHPFGVGSDVIDKTNDWYDSNLPQMPEQEKLFPSSEPLMYAGFAGWIGLILFIVAMLLPFFERTSNYFFWFALNFIMAFSFLFDIGLEAQFGVFIYAFIVLWWWKWLKIIS